MTRNTVRFKVTINSNGIASDMPGFLDMLRYEGGTVRGWNHDADGRWTVEIVVEAHLHQPDRWASFGIYPKEVAS